MEHDRAGNAFFEVESWEEESQSEQIRLTYVQEGFDGGPTIRIQVRQPISAGWLLASTAVHTFALGLP